MTPSNSRSPPDSGARRKSVLYCPECGHESPIGGDWCVAHVDVVGCERVAYACPDCGHVLTVRPARERASA